MRQLTRLADEFGVAVVVTNQVISVCTLVVPTAANLTFNLPGARWSAPQMVQCSKEMVWNLLGETSWLMHRQPESNFEKVRRSSSFVWTAATSLIWLDSFFCIGLGEQRVAKVVDSPMLPEAEATYAIAETGIVDVDEDWEDQPFI